MLAYLVQKENVCLLLVMDVTLKFGMTTMGWSGSAPQLAPDLQLGN